MTQQEAQHLDRIQRMWEWRVHTEAPTPYQIVEGNALEWALEFIKTHLDTTMEDCTDGIVDQ